MTSILRTVDDIRTQLTRKEDEILQVQRRIDDCEKEMKADKVPWEIRIQHLRTTFDSSKPLCSASVCFCRFCSDVLVSYDLASYALCVFVCVCVFLSTSVFSADSGSVEQSGR